VWLADWRSSSPSFHLLRRAPNKEMNQAQGAIEAASARIARVHARTLGEPRAAVAAAEDQVQEVRSALRSGNCAGVQGALSGVATSLQAASTQIDAAASPGGARRRP
jgi:hypothetical protein